MNFKPKKETLAVISLLLLTIVLFFGFGLHHLTQFVTADEHYWTYERIPRYWQALSDFNLKKTYINDKPGITLAIISGVGLFAEENPKENFKKIDEDLKAFNVSKTEAVNFAFRLPILIFNGIFLIYLFWIIKKITGNPWIAVWSAIFIGLSPVLLGISQIINPDALLWTFSTAAILSYFALLRVAQKKFILLTALFTGLAILTKYTANILIPSYFLLLFLNYLFSPEKHTAQTMSRYLTDHFKKFIFIFLGILVTITLFLPAVFVKPNYLYRLTVGFELMEIILGTIAMIIFLFLLDKKFYANQGFFVSLNFLKKYRASFKIILATITLLFAILVLGRNLFSEWPLFQTVYFDIKELDYARKLGHPMNYLEKLIFEFNPLVFSTTPIVLLLVLFIWIKAIFTKNSPHYFYTLSLSLFTLAYFLASILMDVAATVRYSIIIYPLLAFVAAIGLWSIFEKLRAPKISWLVIFSLGAIGLSAASLIWTQPFYFNYTSALLPKKAVIADAWGYGGYEAAQYLNALPDAKNLTVWSDYYGVCEFFVGHCLTDYTLETGRYAPDYFVLTRRGQILYLQNRSKWGRDNGVKAKMYYDNPNPLWEIAIGDRPGNFTKIFPK